MSAALRAQCRLPFLIATLLVGVSATLSNGCQQIVGAKDRNLDPDLTADASAPSPECSNYCTAIQASCTGANSQYVSLPVCLADCAHFPSDPTPDVKFGNSVQCRQYWATVAGNSGEPAEHCSTAGPEGDGTCGSACESYCSLIIPICPTAFSGLLQCLHDCSKMNDLASYNTSDQRGDTVQCRIFHVSAATQSPSSHCPHAGTVSTQYCDSDAGPALGSTCTIAADADDCDRCEAEKCCAEKNDCYNDTICDTADGDFDQCIDLAASIDAGTGDCHAKFVATNAYAATFENCLRGHCASECEIPDLPQ